MLAATEKIELPNAYVADDAFALSRHCMKPFPHKSQTSGQRIFNYRLSRARRTSENAFRILVHRFRSLMARLNVSPEVASSITLACCVLHNLLITVSSAYAGEGYGDTVQTNGDIAEGEWRSADDFQNVSLQASSSRHSEIKAEEIRLHFMRYFETVGQVEWQWKHIF